MATGATISTTSLTGLGLSGLSSGLDTSGIITKLMAIESAPQGQLKTQLSSLQTHTTALQALNTAVAGIATTAKSALAANALSSFTATSSSSSATATASSTASTGSVSFTVDRLAAAQVTVTAAMTSWDTTTTPSITIRTNANGSSPKDTTLTFASSNLDDVVSAINGQGLGVTATKVAAGTDPTGAMQYRLQLRSSTGAANAFSVSPGTAYSAGSTLGTTIASAADAQLTLYAGTGAEQQVTSASNTFSDLMTGVDVAVSAVSASPVTVDVAADVTAASASASALTSGLISLFAGIASSSAISTSSSSSGGTSSTSTSGGVFTGDGLVRLAKDSLLSAVSGAVGGKSPSSIGINLTKDGTITFDQSKFESAMRSDPAGTTAMYQSIATAVSKAATAVADPYTGSLTQQVTSEQGQQSSITSKISDWDTRLAAIQAQYTLQFNNLETALSNLSAQGNYLTSQITGLTTNYQK
ncbi:flagellar filament capping protein FliD [uncultured Amnibacterium sp.]|uniref:flagellar filament capping protein FliD n=1 Tax=uncultured Amnibacterium sp. TaxID=1631851 RepID=UPI0035CAB299